jgi:hypothetical protein
VWYSASGVKPNTMVRFDPETETFAKADIPSGGGVVRNMAATKDGGVYIAAVWTRWVWCSRDSQPKWEQTACSVMRVIRNRKYGLRINPWILDQELGFV